MPRRHERPPPPPPRRKIEPNGLYYLEEARRLLRLARDIARAEIASGRLRAAVCGKRYYLKGQWLLDWLDALPAASADRVNADPSLAPALRRALAAASRLDAGERRALREWLDGRESEGE